MNTFSEPFTRVFLDRLEALLPQHLTASRWYRAKTRTIQRVQVHDAAALNEGFFLLVVDVSYVESDTDRYVLPLEVACLTSSADEVLATDALANSHFRDALLKAIGANASFQGAKGRFAAAHTSVFQPPAAALESFVSKAEQSNTSIIYPGNFIFKLFRKIEPGINPDLEVARFLTEYGFRNTPALLGSLEYLDDAGTYSAGILQRFVPNRGDAWKYTLEALASPIEHYLGSARLLGIRTAEMHTVLASSNVADFVPEPFTSAEGTHVYEEIRAQAAQVFDLMRQAAKAGHPTAELNEVLALEPRILGRLAKLKEPLSGAPVRIRIHGDYHLGQVLYTGDDFMIIDFEGEPARPLAERRAKAVALRDVAGMLRSFDYAAHASPGAHGGTQAWLRQTTAAYLDGYFQTAEGQPYLSAIPATNQFLLDIFLLHKALYEVAYELNNRPDWVSIPLRGILSLFA